MLRSDNGTIGEICGLVATYASQRKIFLGDLPRHLGHVDLMRLAARVVQLVENADCGKLGLFIGFCLLDEGVRKLVKIHWLLSKHTSS